MLERVKVLAHVPAPRQTLFFSATMPPAIEALTRRILRSPVRIALQAHVLVATDIAARGIDVESLGHVINFELPKAPEDYIHRVGRTARAGSTGEAITLVAPEEEAELRRVERAVAVQLPRVRLEELAYNATAEAPLEVPRGERIAAIRAQRAVAQARSAAKTEKPAGRREADRAGPRRRRMRGRRR